MRNSCRKVCNLVWTVGEGGVPHGDRSSIWMVRLESLATVQTKLMALRNAHETRGSWQELRRVPRQGSSAKAHPLCWTPGSAEGPLWVGSRRGPTEA